MSINFNLHPLEWEAFTAKAIMMIKDEMSYLLPFPPPGVKKRKPTLIIWARFLHNNRIMFFQERSHGLDLWVGGPEEAKCGCKAEWLYRK